MSSLHVSLELVMPHTKEWFHPFKDECITRVFCLSFLWHRDSFTLRPRVISVTLSCPVMLTQPLWIRMLNQRDSEACWLLRLALWLLSLGQMLYKSALMITAWRGHSWEMSNMSNYASGLLSQSSAVAHHSDLWDYKENSTFWFMYSCVFFLFCRDLRFNKIKDLQPGSFRRLKNLNTL